MMIGRRCLLQLSRSLRRQNGFGMVAIFVVFIIVLHFILKMEQEEMQQFAGIDIEIPVNFKPIRITRREPLLLKGMGKSMIPKIIHQTWKNTNIPPAFVSWIKSWLILHPDWEYWLWTDESAENLIADKYPQLLDTYLGYLQPIRRADALRYVVLYEYGGVYADMDMEALTPIDPLTMKYSCFIGQEPFEHPAMDTNTEVLVINALIGCRKGHPFMKMLTDNLVPFAHMWSYLDSTGPHFVTYFYQQYIEQYPFSKDDKDSVYLAPSEYFYPTIDPAKISYILLKCKERVRLLKLQYKACMNLKYKNLPENIFNPLSIAFANHHWFHTYLRVYINTGDTSIYDICPSVHIYHHSETQGS